MVWFTHTERCVSTGWKSCEKCDALIDILYREDHQSDLWIYEKTPESIENPIGLEESTRMKCPKETPLNSRKASRVMPKELKKILKSKRNRKWEVNHRKGQDHRRKETTGRYEILNEDLMGKENNFKVKGKETMMLIEEMKTLVSMSWWKPSSENQLFTEHMKRTSTREAVFLIH